MHESMMRSDLAGGRQGAQRVVDLLQQIFKVRQVDLAAGLQALQPLRGLDGTPHQGSLNQGTKPPAVTFSAVVHMRHLEKDVMLN